MQENTNKLNFDILKCTYNHELCKNLYENVYVSNFNLFKNKQTFPKKTLLRISIVNSAHEVIYYNICEGFNEIHNPTH